ncbi:protein-glutamate O-methyltransferase [Thermodesulfobacterium sp. TA1]|uniref:putative metalloprotease CJM1_0395 family protein n=1 Tax=Thermodesulfobacterium sp. TA1 TaxID=2234087 RepID=UPI0012322B7B|nr:putative metalloprotease CJM1_0395 family protein [Thermodesulfobacterium sp. TA1]QER42575.1 protein-glutamate O-methyltransferase [Thermodesulfobacterium sp. TA1]
MDVKPAGSEPVNPWFSKRAETLEDLKVRMLIQKLKIREKQVISHEMAHKTVGGKYAGSVHYEYTRGPDGRFYITGGEVSIDLSEEDSPEKTIRKMQIVRAAALAPADPSPQDLQVAQAATIKEIKARQELALLKEKEQSQPKGKLLNTKA